MVVLKLQRFHQKGLGFCSMDAIDLIERDDLLGCKQNYFALIDPQIEGEPWQIRCVKTEPSMDSEVLTLPYEEVVSRPELALKSIWKLDSKVKLTFNKNIWSICTEERTLLITSSDDSFLGWADLTQKYLTRAQTNSVTRGHRATLRNNNRDSAQTNRNSPSIPFESIFTNPTLLGRFRDFLKFSFAEENLTFYEEVEACQSIPIENDTNLRETATKIVNKYVKESSPEQVNLSYQNARSLIESLESPGVEIGEVILCLAQSQHEIFELMRRNFYYRFVASVESEQRRDRLVEEAKGCFSHLFEHSGIDSYSALMKHFNLMQMDMNTLLNFVKKRLDYSQSYVDGSLKIAAAEFKAARLNSIPLVSTNRAIRSIFDLFDLQTKTIVDYLEDCRNYVLMPLMELSKNIQEGTESVRALLQPQADAIVITRNKAIDLAKAEENAKQQVVTLSAKLAELESAPKRKEKDIKQAQVKFDKAKMDLSAIQSNKSNEEFKLVTLESSARESFLSGLDQLESIALYRLDTLQEVMKRLVHSEQTQTTRLGLKLQGTLNDCSHIVATQDLVNLAHDANEIALTSRRGSLSAVETTYSNSVVPIQALEVIPTAQVASDKSSSRRWF